jgi:hypothetical protein
MKLIMLSNWKLIIILWHAAKEKMGEESKACADQFIQTCPYTIKLFN